MLSLKLSTCPTHSETSFTQLKLIQYPLKMKNESNWRTLNSRRNQLEGSKNQRRTNFKDLKLEEQPTWKTTQNPSNFLQQHRTAHGNRSEGKETASAKRVCVIRESVLCKSARDRTPIQPANRRAIRHLVRCNGSTNPRGRSYLALFRSPRTVRENSPTPNAVPDFPASPLHHRPSENPTFPNGPRSRRGET